MDDKEDRIRTRAYELWLLDGQPEGREDEYWFRAAEAVRFEDLDLHAAQPSPTSEVINGYFARGRRPARSAPIPIPPVVTQTQTPPATPEPGIPGIEELPPRRYAGRT